MRVYLQSLHCYSTQYGNIHVLLGHSNGIFGQRYDGSTHKGSYTFEGKYRAVHKFAHHWRWAISKPSGVHMQENTHHSRCQAVTQQSAQDLDPRYGFYEFSGLLGVHARVLVE